MSHVDELFSAHQLFTNCSKKIWFMGEAAAALPQNARTLPYLIHNIKENRTLYCHRCRAPAIWSSGIWDGGSGIGVSGGGISGRGGEGGGIGGSEEEVEEAERK